MYNEPETTITVIDVAYGVGDNTGFAFQFAFIAFVRSFGIDNYINVYIKMCVIKSRNGICLKINTFIHFVTRMIPNNTDFERVDK